MHVLLGGGIAGLQAAEAMHTHLVSVNHHCATTAVSPQLLSAFSPT